MKLTVLLIMFLSFTSLVLAITVIQSNVIIITRSAYELKLTAPKTDLANNETLVLTATYTKNGVPVADSTVYLYRENLTAYTTCNTTQADGTCQLTYDNLENGTWKVWAEAETP